MNTESTLQRLVRKALTKRQHRNADGTPRDLGVGVTGVVVTIVILGILAAIGGPTLWRLITDAREFSVNSTITQAAEVVQNRLTLSPELMTDAKPGGAFDPPAADLENALLEDYDLNWVIISDGATAANQDFGFKTATGDDQTVRVQFFTKATTETIATNTTAPAFDWLLDTGKAVRIQAQNTDGAWACALIVMRPDIDQANIVKASFVGEIPTGLAADANSKVKLDVWTSGIWFDKGDEPLTPDNGLHACSPIHNIGSTAVDAPFPTSTSTWPYGEPAPTSAVTDVPGTAWRTLTNAF